MEKSALNATTDSIIMTLNMCANGLILSVRLPIKITGIAEVVMQATDSMRGLGLVRYSSKILTAKIMMKIIVA